MRSHDNKVGRAAALGLGLVLVVIVASAAIRQGAGFDAAFRLLHRSAATLEVAIVAWLAWMAWRSRAARPALFAGALFAGGVTLFLSVLGIAAGQNPPAAAQAANLLGGLALAATFAWVLGRSMRGAARSVGPALSALVVALLALQISLGAGVSVGERLADALPAHALLAVALSAFLAWLGWARLSAPAGKILFGLALAAPLAGFSALHLDHSAAAAVVHGAAAAGLVAAAAYALGCAA